MRSGWINTDVTIRMIRRKRAGLGSFKSNVGVHRFHLQCWEKTVQAEHIPPSIDWRKKGAVTSIRDETCGAWTFPAVDTVEGITKIKGGKLYNLSVQELVDCHPGFEEGCDGGFVPPNNEDTLMKAVANQPVPVTDASGYDFQFYSTVVFTGQCGDSLDHGVTVLGYVTENGKLKYWIIKNSWGSSWGEDGYMRLQKDIADKKGICWIAVEVYYPVI
ncbi:thiol protease SEN102-like [Primulina tabacum]|uniref:thiol protease SEN102-like n=1 Tax=Primulina tabacum TaxID=48773 RepID=UPI003F5A2850